jgi:hypothetical protein
MLKSLGFAFEVSLLIIRRELYAAYERSISSRRLESYGWRKTP